MLYMITVIIQTLAISGCRSANEPSPVLHSWNSLPAFVLDSNSLAVFKSKLKLICSPLPIVDSNLSSASTSEAMALMHYTHRYIIIRAVERLIFLIALIARLIILIAR